MEKICDYTDIGKWIRKERRRQNLTQYDLAEISGYTSAFISRVETGTAQPTVTTAEDIINALGYKIVLGIEANN